jgi:hypothetical protein
MRKERDFFVPNEYVSMYTRFCLQGKTSRWNVKNCSVMPKVNKANNASIDKKIFPEPE